MKKLIALVTSVFLAVSVHAQDDARLAELEAKVKTLEMQNHSLKSAIEAMAGKPLHEILVSTTKVSSATVAPAPTQAAKPTGPTPEQKAAIAEVKRRIAEIENSRKVDPFANPRGLRMSRADVEKAQAAQNVELANLKARLAAMEAIVSRQ